MGSRLKSVSTEERRADLSLIKIMFAQKYGTSVSNSYLAKVLRISYNSLMAGSFSRDVYLLKEYLRMSDDIPSIISIKTKGFDGDIYLSMEYPPVVFEFSVNRPTYNKCSIVYDIGLFCEFPDSIYRDFFVSFEVQCMKMYFDFMLVEGDYGDIFDFMVNTFSEYDKPDAQAITGVMTKVTKARYSTREAKNRLVQGLIDKKHSEGDYYA